MDEELSVKSCVAQRTVLHAQTAMQSSTFEWGKEYMCDNFEFLFSGQQFYLCNRCASSMVSQMLPPFHFTLSSLPLILVLAFGFLAWVFGSLIVTEHS